MDDPLSPGRLYVLRAILGDPEGPTVVTTDGLLEISCEDPRERGRMEMELGREGRSALQARRGRVRSE